MTQQKNNELPRFSSTAMRLLPTLVRLGAIAGLLVIAVSVSFRLAAPYLISTTLVRSGMESAISEWTGNRAAIGGGPQLEFWPEPKITLDNVMLRKPAETGEAMLLSVDQLSASFNLFGALLGQPDFYDFHFLRPRVSITRLSGGAFDWPGKGLLSQAIREVRPTKNGQKLDRRLNAQIGSISIEDGTLVFRDDANGGRTTRLDAINGKIAWPSLADGLQSSLAARIRDREFKLDISSTQPLLLLAGKNAQATALFNSPALAVQFDGVANFSTYGFLSGYTDINAPDMPSLLSWSGIPLPSVRKLQRAAIRAQVMTTDRSLRFSDLQLTIDDARATGIMDLSISPSGRPKMAGTLAFDEMNVREFMAAFSLNPFERKTAAEPADTAFMRQLGLDLRLSAKRAALDPFELRNVGASVLITEDRATFDIGDSELAGGALSGHLEVAERGFDGSANLQISIRDADFESMAKRSQFPGPLPLARGSMDLSLKTGKPLWATGVDDISGSFRLRAGPGTLRQFDARALRAFAAARKSTFPLSELGDGSFDFNSADLQLTFGNGFAEIGKSAIVGPKQTLTLYGVIPYSSNRMGLVGVLKANSAAEAHDFPPFSFAATHSWPDPVISPLFIR